MLSLKNMMPDQGQGQAAVQIDGQTSLSIVDPIDVEIEGFTEKDFDEGKPFLFCLQNHNDNEVLFQSLLNKVRHQAERLKIKTGERSDYAATKKAVFGAHPELLPKKNSGTAPVSTGFSDIEQFFGNNPVNYGGYIASDNGIVLAGTTPMGIDVCMHALVVSEMKTNVATGEESIEIAFRLPGEKTWRKVSIATEKAVTKMGIVRALASRGCDVTEDSARDLIAYIRMFMQKNREIIKHSRVSSKLGWQPDGSFVPLTGDIKLDESRLGAFTEKGLALHSHGDKDVWLDGIRKFRKLPTARASIILMDGSFAAPLIYRTNGLPFFIHMSGNGSTGKTVSMRMAGTIWGYAPRAGGWMTNLNKTNNHLEEFAKFANNYPVLLNELQILQRSNPKVLTEFVYRVCEGEGKGRLDRNANARDSGVFSTIFLTCGEEGLIGEGEHGGAKSRVIDLVVDQPIMPPEELKPFCQNVLDKSYGHAGKMFIDAISAMTDDEINQQISDITERLQKYGKATKQIDAAAILLFADEIAEKYIFQDGIRISDREMLDYLKEDKEIDDNIMAFDALKSLISGHDNNFIDRDNHIEPRGEVWGRIENGGKLVYFTKAYFDREMRNLGYDPLRLIRWLVNPNHNYVEDGRLDKDGNRKEGDNHIDKAVRGMNPLKTNAQTRCYILHMDGGANLFPGYAKAVEYDEQGNVKSEPASEPKKDDVKRDPVSGFQQMEVTPDDFPF